MMSNKILPLDGKYKDLLYETFTNSSRTGYIKVDDFVMAKSYEKFANCIEEFEIRDDDVWVCSLPKAGTTWTQEMVWCIANDLDFERGKIPLTDRFPFFEVSYLIDKTDVLRNNPDTDIPEHTADSFKFVAQLPSPRFIKSHLPFELLPRQLRTGEKKAKIIYVVRNAKDTCISYFHHCKLMYAFRGSLENFYTLYLGDTITYAPFWKHVIGYWDKRDRDNVLFLKFDDMKKDLPLAIEKTASFLGKELTIEQVSSLSEHLKFSNMRKNPAVNNEQHVNDVQKIMQVNQQGYFMRCGKTDQWKTIMTADVIERFDEWTQKNLNDTGLSI